MRDTYKFAGETVKVKDGVGHDHMNNELSGEDFVIEDWFENVVGVSWLHATGNPTALIYAMRSARYGANNEVPAFSTDVLYGKIKGMGYAFHVNELELPEEN